MIKIITDSSSNISQQEAEKLGITVLPLGVSFGVEQYLDGIDITNEQFYAKLAESKEFPHTSQPSEQELDALFKRECAQNEQVLVMLIANELSGTHSLAVKVAKDSGLENIRVYSTDATTVILKILVLEALKNAQKPVDEVIKILDELRPRIKLFAAIDTLEYLKKGGRLSGTASIIGKMLKIKPVIIQDIDGKIKLISKQIGMNNSIKTVAEKASAFKIDKSYPVYFLYTQTPVNCDKLIAKLGDLEGEKVNICPVIGTHIGPAGAGITFVAAKD